MAARNIKFTPSVELPENRVNVVGSIDNETVELNILGYDGIIVHHVETLVGNIQGSNNWIKVRYENEDVGRRLIYGD